MLKNTVPVLVPGVLPIPVLHMSIQYDYYQQSHQLFTADSITSLLLPLEDAQ